MFVGIGIGINRQRPSGESAGDLLEAYKNRVLTNGGVFEATACVYRTFVNWGVAPMSSVAVAATGITATSFIANWEAILEASSYALDVSTDSSFSTFVLQNQVVYTNSYTVTGLIPGTTYYYRVRADI